MRYLLLLLVPAVLEAQVTEVWFTKGPTDYPFGDVAGVHEVTPDSLWVLDRISDHHIHVLDGSGRFLGRLGRDGEGPGELPSITIGATLPEGGMAITSAVEIQLLDAEGGYLSKFPLAFSAGAQKDVEATEHFVVLSSGMREFDGRKHPHAVAVYDRAGGKILTTFHPANPTDGRAGYYQSGAELVVRGPNVIAVNTAPIEVVEYELGTGRKLRTLVATDSSLVNDLGESYQFRLKDYPRAIFHRWHAPRVRYAELLGPDRLLTVTVFPLKDYALRPDELALDIPPEDYERSVWDVYDLTTGERISRTESSRAYEVFDRTTDGAFLATYLTRLDEAVVVKLRLQPE